MGGHPNCPVFNINGFQDAPLQYGIVGAVASRDDIAKEAHVPPKDGITIFIDCVDVPTATEKDVLDIVTQHTSRGDCVPDLGQAGLTTHQIPTKNSSHTPSAFSLR